MLQRRNEQNYVIHRLWIKLAKLPDEIETQQIIPSNTSYEFILITSELSSFNSYKYNTHTKSLKPFATIPDFDCFYSIKVAFDSKQQIVYILHGTDIYSISATWNKWQKFNQTTTEFGNYFLFENNHLHIIKNHDIHFITSIENHTLNTISDPTDEYEYMYACKHAREDAAAIFISSKQCILLIGGYSNKFSLQTWIFSLKTYTWKKINIPFDRYDFGYVLTSNQKYIIFFGGWEYNNYRNSNVELNDIFVLDIEDMNVNNWKLKKCKIRCPHAGTCYVATTGSRNGSNVLVNGFVKKCFKLTEFEKLTIPPVCIINTIGKFYSAEMIHYIAGAEHYEIYLKDILSSLYK